MKVTLLLGLAALAGVFVVLGVLPAALLPCTAGPAVALGFAWPVLRRWSPAEPSMLKLTVVSALASAPAAAAVFACLVAVPGLGLAPDRALAATLAIAVVLAVAAEFVPSVRRTEPEPESLENRGRLGAAAWGALGLACVLSGGIAWIVLGGGAGPRVLPPGAIWHAGIAGLFARGGPLENPWLAGEALPTHPGYGALVATIASAFGLSAPRAMAWLGVASLALLPVVIYLFAAPLWREKWRTFLAPLLALLAWNAADGLRWPMVDLSGEASGSWFGLAAFVRPGPVAPALALGAGAWMCAAHALRHGQRPWVAACAFLAGGALAVHPALGTATLAALLLAAAVSPVPAGVRSKLAIACTLAAFPGAALVWRFGASALPVRPHAGPGAWGAAALIAAAPLVLLALGLLIGRGKRDAILLRLAVSAVVAPPALVWLGVVDPLDAPGLLRLAGLPLGLLAAGGAVDLFAGRVPARVAGALACAALALGAAAVHWTELGRVHALSRTFVPVVDGHGVVAPSAGPGAARTDNSEARAAAYAWLRAQHALRARRPIFVRSVALDSNRVGGSFAPHPAGLYADLPMWCDRRIDFSPTSTLWHDRHERLHQLYRDRERWEPRMIREFERVGRPAVFLVEERDRIKTLRGAMDVEFRGVDNRLQRMGCKRIFAGDKVALYLWEPGEGTER